MEEAPPLHRIEDDLTDTWIKEYATKGVESIETYLSKWLAFYVQVEEMESNEGPDGQVPEQAA